jgi:hypothetical protein
MLQGVKTCSYDRWNIACMLVIKVLSVVFRIRLLSHNSPMVMTVGFHFKRIILFYQKMSIILSIRTCEIWLDFKTFNNTIKLISFSGNKFDSV